jgi:hypothetical protein
MVKNEPELEVYIHAISRDRLLIAIQFELRNDIRLA